MARVRENIFVSYNRKDRKWLEKLEVMLKPLVRKENLKIWDDSQILPGAFWYPEIQNAIASAGIAILLVSADFLDSNFIIDHELPMLLEASKEGLHILWLAVGHSMYKYTDLTAYQALNDPSAPLNRLSGAKLEQELLRISAKIKEVLETMMPETS